MNGFTRTQAMKLAKEAAFDAIGLEETATLFDEVASYIGEGERAVRNHAGLLRAAAETARCASRGILTLARIHDTIERM